MSMRVVVAVSAGEGGAWNVAVAGAEPETHKMAAIDEGDAIAVRLAAGRPQKGDVETMGRRLFVGLIGDAAWTRIKQRAGKDSIELALSWEAHDLDRLHWE